VLSLLEFFLCFLEGLVKMMSLDFNISSVRRLDCNVFQNVCEQQLLDHDESLSSCNADKSITSLCEDCHQLIIDAKGH
jgi:hypothetical protein